MDLTSKISLCLGVFVVLVGLVGCEPKEQVNERQERLYSVENMELKKQIAELENKHEQELADKQQQLDKCRSEKSLLQEQFGKATMESFEQSAVKGLMEQIKQLRNENAQLKAEIDNTKQESQQQE